MLNYFYWLDKRVSELLMTQSVLKCTLFVFMDKLLELLRNCDGGY